MDKLKELELRIENIEKRNISVEVNKSWETSKTRRLSIAMLTYASIAAFFLSINVPNPLINAIVPTIGFLLSTLSLPFIRKLWERHFK